VTIRELYHGGNGDKILEIIQSGQIQPDWEHKLYFSEDRDSAFMHGPDSKRKLTFVVKVRVQIPPETNLERTATPGVSRTLKLTTSTPIRAEVLELYIRTPRSSTVQVVHGSSQVQRFLSNAV
jgi:hypothetical protein